MLQIQMFPLVVLFRCWSQADLYLLGSGLSPDHAHRAADHYLAARALTQLPHLGMALDLGAVYATADLELRCATAPAPLATAAEAEGMAVKLPTPMRVERSVAKEPIIIFSISNNQSESLFTVNVKRG